MIQGTISIYIQIYTLPLCQLVNVFMKVCDSLFS